MARHTVFFSFVDEAAAIAALGAWRGFDDQGAACWREGVDAGFPIVDATAVFDEAGELVTPATYLTGYHVNILTAMRDAALEGADGWTGTSREDAAITDPTLKWVLMAGDAPATARRVFA
ncbi:MAG: hypothetical protein GC184_14680 [Rhizobiales bacterium]|nr:hypothetical protein [Hyphomicrobiales bacterium]